MVTKTLCAEDPKKIIFRDFAWPICQIPYLCISTLVFCAICFSMAGIATSTATQFFQYWFVFFEYASSITFFGIFVAMLTPNAEVSQGDSICPLPHFPRNVLKERRSKWPKKGKLRLLWPSESSALSYSSSLIERQIMFVPSPRLYLLQVAAPPQLRILPKVSFAPVLKLFATA